MKCPKCGAWVSMDGIGKANSAMCLSCGASILAPQVQPEVLATLAERRETLRTATRKHAKPESGPKRKGPILKLSVLDPVVDLEATGRTAPADEPVTQPAPVECDSVPQAESPEPVIMPAAFVPQPPPVRRAIDAYELDTLPRLQEADRIAKRRAEELKARPPSDIPPPLPDRDWVVRGFPSENENNVRVDPMALICVVCGFASFLCGLGPLLSIPGLFLGLAAMVRISGSRGRWKGKELARVGVVVNVINLVVAWMFFVSRW